MHSRTISPPNALMCTTLQRMAERVTIQVRVSPAAKAHMELLAKEFTTELVTTTLSDIARMSMQAGLPLVEKKLRGQR